METKVITFILVCSHLRLSQFLFLVLIFTINAIYQHNCECRCYGVDLEYEVCNVMFCMLVLQHVA